ncbi:hypothetical protein Tco_1331227, partial [Tanacetum coccineum]
VGLTQLARLGGGIYLEPKLYIPGASTLGVSEEWGGRGGGEGDDGDMVGLVGGDDEVVGVAMVVGVERCVEVGDDGEDMVYDEVEIRWVVMRLMV